MKVKNVQVKWQLLHNVRPKFRHHKEHTATYLFLFMYHSLINNVHLVATEFLKYPGTLKKFPVLIFTPQLTMLYIKNRTIIQSKFINQFSSLFILIMLLLSLTIHCPSRSE